MKTVHEVDINEDIPVGELFVYVLKDGTEKLLVPVRKVNNCRGCFFESRLNCDELTCMPMCREDEIDVIFKEVKA